MVDLPFLPLQSQLELPALAHTHACRRTPAVIQGEKHFKMGAKVTKCLSSQGRHRREKAHQALCQRPLLLYLILTHGVGPLVILANGAGKRGTEGLSSLSRTNSS